MGLGEATSRWRGSLSRKIWNAGAELRTRKTFFKFQNTISSGQKAQEYALFLGSAQNNDFPQFRARILPLLRPFTGVPCALDLNAASEPPEDFREA